MLNLAVTLSDIINQQNLLNPELTVTLMFFDGEEAMVSWTSTDSVYGSTHLADDWAVRDYVASSEFCQYVSATYMDRMDLLFLWDLIGTPEPDFQRFMVHYFIIHYLIN